MFPNLLFKSLREDRGALKTGRSKAFVKRFLKLLIGAGDGGAEFFAGGLYLLGEVGIFNFPISYGFYHYRTLTQGFQLFSTEGHLKDLLDPSRSLQQRERQYDPKARDPQYANTDPSSLRELIPLL